MIYEPIFVAGPARCGTTMITGLLHYHGCWVGHAKVTKAKDTNPPFGSENVALKQFLRKTDASANPVKCKTMFEALMEGDPIPYEGDRPWVVKTAQLLIKQELMMKMYPGATWLLPYRPFDDIINSALRHPGMSNDRKQRENVANIHIGLQERLVLTGETYHTWVDVDAMGRGSMEEARRVVEFCGLDFIHDVWEQWIQPERWHGA